MGAPPLRVVVVVVVVRGLRPSTTGRLSGALVVPTQPCGRGGRHAHGREARGGSRRRRRRAPGADGTRHEPGLHEARVRDPLDGAVPWYPMVRRRGAIHFCSSDGVDRFLLNHSRKIVQFHF